MRTETHEVKDRVNLKSMEGGGGGYDLPIEGKIIVRL